MSAVVRAGAGDGRQHYMLCLLRSMVVSFEYPPDCRRLADLFVGYVSVTGLAVGCVCSTLSDARTLLSCQRQYSHFLGPSVSTREVSHYLEHD